MHHHTQASAGSATGHGRMTPFPEGEGLTPSACYVSRLSLPLRASLLAWQLPVGTTTGLRLVWFAHSATLPDSQPVFQAQRLRPWVVRGFTSYESGMACLVVVDAPLCE